MREEIVKKAKRRGLTDPAEIILGPIPQYSTFSRFIPPLQVFKLGETLDRDPVAKVRSDESHDPQEINLFQIYHAAKVTRERELSQVPSTFVDE